MSNFIFGHKVFKKSSAAIASKCVCRWVRVPTYNKYAADNYEKIWRKNVENLFILKSSLRIELNTS